MEIDKTTLNDLSVFNTDDSFSILNKIDLTLTSNGKEQLRRNFSAPMESVDDIIGIQETLKSIIGMHDQWPKQISNGTIKVIERFYETAIDPPPAVITKLNAATYKLIHGPDYSLVKYSAIHCFDFIKGMQQFVDIFLNGQTPAPFQKELADIEKTISQPAFNIIKRTEKAASLSIPELLQLARFIRFQFRHQMMHLLNIHAKLDAWFGMAMAVKEYKLVFPTFTGDDKPFIEATGLYHILLQDPVGYDIVLHHEKNFLFLTGANMAGKSTFIKSVGTAVFLAHTGMGVPAKNMSLCPFHGILSNINVADNIVKGESYFFNEVQRIKSTIQKINDGRRWLILIDELFKGTNMQDAMKCSSLVIEGLLKMKNAIFILSTHLYEIGEPLKKHSNIQFNYFETQAVNGQLEFSYHLQDGISNDRFGYLILKKEGVVDLLDKL